MKKFILLSFIFFFFAASAYGETFYYEYGKKVELTKLPKTKTRNNTTIQYYKKSDGSELGVKGEVIVECEKGFDCYDVFNKYNLIDIEKISETFFLIKLIDKDVFEISQQLYNEDGIKIAHPNFVRKRYQR